MDDDNNNQNQDNNNQQGNNQRQANQPNPREPVRNVRPRLAHREGPAADLFRDLNIPIQPAFGGNAGANPQNPAFVNVQDPNLRVADAPRFPNLADASPAQNNNQPIRLRRRRRRAAAPAIVMPEPQPIRPQAREQNRIPNEAAANRRNVRNIPQDGSLQLPNLPNRPPNRDPNRILSGSLQPRQEPRQQPGQNPALLFQNFAIPAQNRAAQNPAVNNAAAANPQPQESTAQGNSAVAALAQPRAAAQRNPNVARAAVAQRREPEGTATFRPIRSPRTPAGQEETKESPRSSQSSRRSNRKRKGPPR